MTNLLSLRREVNVLIAEDENIVALQLTQTLTRKGYLIVGVVNNALSAIEESEKIRPDLILMDIKLKGKMDGTEAAHKIHACYNIPVIFLTAYSDANTLARAKMSKPYGYLLKPLDPHELSNTIEIALRKHQMLQFQQLFYALKKSEESFNLLVESAIDYGIFMVDPNGIVMSWSKGAEKIKGFNEHEVLGKDFSMFYEKKDIEAGMPLQELRMAATENQFKNKSWRMRKDGSIFWGSVVIVPFRDEAGNICGFGKVTRDLTREKKAEDALLESNESFEKRIQERTTNLNEAIQIRDEFLSIASHELKNPLTVLLILLQTLRKKFDLDNKILQEKSISNAKSISSSTALVQSCEVQVKKLNFILDELFDLTQIRIGKFHLYRENIDLRSLVNDVVESKKVELNKSGSIISVKAHFPVIGYWDPMRVEQIVENLLSNAIKYGDDKPIEISVEINMEKQCSILKVKDHGRGMSQEMQGRLFRRFERDYTSKVTSGLGLGLYIVQKIVLAHGGSISISSHLRKGSEFTVELPLVEVEAKFMEWYDELGVQ